MGASELTPIPARDQYGMRVTINSNISTAQRTWNLRSAFNVAALNCMEVQHAPILEAYKRFLTTHKKGLLATYKTVDREWRDRMGAGFVQARESYSTKVYNYFALPPVLPGFCSEMLTISGQSLAVQPRDLDAFSARSLARIEGVFERFYLDFEKFKRDVANWDATYKPMRAPFGGPSPSVSMNGLRPNATAN